MGKERWNRREAISDAPPLSVWPVADVNALSVEDAELYRARKKATEMYVAGFLLSEIEAATGIKRVRLPIFLRGCLSLSDDGRIYGFRSLIPRLRIKPYSRMAADKPKLPQAKGGKVGMLQAVLTRFPELEIELRGLILKTRKGGVIHEKKIRATDLHKIFLKRLKELGIKDTEWPFNATYRGRRSIYKYVEHVQQSNFGKAVFARQEQPARAHLAVGMGIPALISFEEPFAAVELDAHFIHAFFSVAFNTPEGTITRVLLERLWLIAMIELGSSAVLAYDVVYSSEVSADDVLRVLKKAAGERWVPMELSIPGLEYPADGGIPSGVIPECDGAIWNCLLLDGHLSHLSNAVRVVSRKRLGFSINWGPVGHFERRPNIERLFKNIEDKLFMRMPSTTGSNPGKGRAENAEEKSVIYKIDAAENEQLLDVAIAQYNATPSEGLSFISPLDYLRFYVNEKKDHFMIRHLPEDLRSNGNIIPQTIICTVRGGKESGRRPYIQLDGVHYTNPVLADAGMLIGQKLSIEFNEDDYRHVRAFLSNGAEIGMLTAQGRWGLTKHSRKTRKQIMRLVHLQILQIAEFDDPVQVYLRHLATSRKVSITQKVISPQRATAAVRVAKEADLPLEMHKAEAPTARRLPPESDEKESAIGRPLPNLTALLNRRSKK